MKIETELEYAVEIKDLDTGGYSLVAVFINEARATDELALDIAEVQHGWMYNGHSLELLSLGRTGIKRLLTFDEKGLQVKAEEKGKSRFADEEYFKVYTFTKIDENIPTQQQPEDFPS